MRPNTEMSLTKLAMISKASRKYVTVVLLDLDNKHTQVFGTGKKKEKLASRNKKMQFYEIQRKINQIKRKGLTEM